MSEGEGEVENEDKTKDKTSINNKENCANREDCNSNINNINENDEKPEENDAPEMIERPPFSYFLEISDNNIEQITFEGDKGKYKYCICLLVKDDCNYNSQPLYKTLKGIEMNLKPLEEELDIKGEQIALFIFINSVKYNYFFTDEDKVKSEENTEFPYLMREKRINEENSKLLNLTVYTISKNDYLSDIKALKLYYSFLKQLKDENKLMFSSVITAGIYPLPESLFSLIQFSYHTETKHGVAVGPIEFKPNNFISKISLYEKIHFNIYNMNYYFESSAVPISSLLCTMCFDEKLLDYLNEYYKSIIHENASIDYHDYNLALNLIRAKNRKFFIKYNYDKALGMIEINDMTFFDYQKEWINRNSGYYGNFFEILRSFVDFKMCKPGEKIFMFFQIIAICIEFILPSLFSMVIYAIFYETFITYDYRVALFFTTLYLCMMFASGVCSLITKEPKRMTITNYFLYIFMEVFYAFVIICSIPAMHHVNIRKNEYGDSSSDYKFNKAAASVLIILSFIIYIIPMILKATVIGNNFISMLIYLFLGASSSTSNFNIAKIWNAPDTSGGNFIEAKKSVCIIMHLCFNLFFGSLSFYNTDRKKRANCIMGFGIMFLIYNFFRTLGITIKMSCNKEESFDNKTLCSNIKQRLEKDENDENDVNENNPEEEDGNNEQKKNNDKENEENNDNNENNNSQENNEQNGNNTEDLQNGEENQNQEGQEENNINNED